MHKNIFFAAVFSLVLFGPLSAKADTTSLVNCFGDYTFGSVSATLSSPTANSVSGATIPVHAVITNNNNYSLVDGSLYIKVYKSQASALQSHANGSDLVDQFYAVNDISIPAKGTVSKDFTWTVPTYALSGSYQIDPYFIVDGKYEILGLTYSDDVHGSPLNVEIKGNTAGVTLDKNSVTINAKPYTFVALPPQLEPSKPVILTTTVVNSTKDSVTIPVVARIYEWDGTSASNHLRDISTTITLAPGKSQIVTFVVTETVSVTFVSVEADYRDTKSILDIRFVRAGLSYPRVNFSSILSNNSSDESSAALFACFHDAGNVVSTPSGKINLVATDESGNVVASSTYFGDITGNMMGMKSLFNFKNPFSTLTLVASAYQSNVLTDKTSVTYSCSDINPALCLRASHNPNTTLFIAIIAVIVLLLLFIAFLIRRKPKVSVQVLIALAVGAGGFGLLSHKALAYTCNSSVQDPDSGYYCTVQVTNIPNPPYVIIKWVEVALPNYDYCPNIDGTQSSIPSGDTLDASGNCVAIDYCPNIPGTQSSIPNGDAIDASGNCVSATAQKSVTWSGSVSNNAGDATQGTLDALKANRANSDCSGTSGPCYLSYLMSMNLGVTYGASVLDSSGNPIADGSTIPIGTKIMLVPENFYNNNISWSIIGGVVGTPYGYWSNQVPSNTNTPENLLTATSNWDYYTPVIVGVPSVTVTPSGTAGLTPNGGNTYTVASGGTLHVAFTYGGTSASTHINRVALSGSSGGSNSSPYSSLNTSVPAQTISFDYTVPTPPPLCTVPSTPTFTGTQNVVAGGSGTYTVTATTPPCNEDLHYNISYDSAHSTIDGTSPDVSSGTAQSFTRTWSTARSYTIWAQAVDDKGASAWTSLTVTVTPQPPVTHTLYVTVVNNGSVSSIPSGISCTNFGGTCNVTSSGSYTLTAAVNNSTFNGWSGGGCSGTGTCTVNISSADESIVATFTNNTPPPSGDTCQDGNANNYGGTLPCTYTESVNINADKSTIACGDSITFTSRAVQGAGALINHGLEYSIGGTKTNFGANNPPSSPVDNLSVTEQFTSAGSYLADAYARSSTDGGTYLYTSNLPFTVTAAKDGTKTGCTTSNNYCTDSNALNNGGTLPCVCNSGYTVSSDGKSCSKNTTNTTTDCTTNPSDPSCSGGGGPTTTGGGGPTGDGGNGGSGFTVGADSAVDPIRFLGSTGATSQARTLYVSPAGNFSNSVTLKVLSITSVANSQQLPSNVTATVSFDASNFSDMSTASRTLTYDSARGYYVNSVGTIGSPFEVNLSAPITQAYNVLIQGTGGGMTSEYTIVLNPNVTNPTFNEI